jgi:HEPN domain-containing protein
MIPLTELDTIAHARLDDAQALHDAGRFDGAVYLCGYAVEVALKARICRALNWRQFPDRKGFESIYTHDLDILLQYSGQELRVKNDHFSDWSNVMQWKEDKRYTIIGTATESASAGMIASAKVLLGVL